MKNIGKTRRMHRPGPAWGTLSSRGGSDLLRPVILTRGQRNFNKLKHYCDEVPPRPGGLTAAPRHSPEGVA